MMRLSLILVPVSIFIITGCTEYSPKPNGYFRIDPPTAEIKQISESDLPFTFSIPENCNILVDSTGKEKATLIIKYPKYNAQILCTYQKVERKNFRTIAEQSRQFVYRHTVKATAINEKTFEHPEEKVYGVFYDLKGNVATPCQFVLTDSIHHYFRGALYFNCAPQADSLAPVVSYIKANMLDLMQTFKWK